MCLHKGLFVSRCLTGHLTLSQYFAAANYFHWPKDFSKKGCIKTFLTMV